MRRLILLNDIVTELESGSRPAGGIKLNTIGIPSVGAEHLNDQGRFNFNNVKFIPSSFFDSQKRGIIKVHDILIVKDGATTGKTSFVDESFPFKKASLNEHVFRIAVDEKSANPKYVFWYLFSEYGKKQIMNNFRGSTIGGITKEFVNGVQLYLPPIDEQHHIVQILDLAQSLIEKRKQAISYLDDYIKSVFLDMFGDPVSNPKGWAVGKFANLGTLDRGRSKNRPRNSPELLGGNHPLIQTGDIANSNIYIENYVSTYSDIGLKQSKKWPRGTLCITIAANIAKTGILAFDACFPDSVVGFIADTTKTSTIFIHFWMSFFQKILEDNAPESAQKNINLKILRDLSVIHPPFKTQEKFASIVQRVVSTQKKMQSQLKELEDNFQVQLQRAFRGE